MDSPSKPSKVVLNEQLAKQIYDRKLLLSASGQSLKGKSVPVSRVFKISPKTVRDIWNRRTWTKATCTEITAYEVSII